MPKNDPIKIGPLKREELSEADRIVRLAFGTALRMPKPLDFMGDRSLVVPRWGMPNVKMIAARDGGRLIGSNVVTRWGSFGFFGPLTVLPEYWDRGVAQRLLGATMAVFDHWDLRHTGLFTFAESTKHVGLYQKFGYWPCYLTALVKYTPDPALPRDGRSVDTPMTLSSFSRSRREAAIEACANLTGKIEKGLDLGDEIRASLKPDRGETMLIYTRAVLDGFAVCLTGPGSEGGKKTCYVKFGAARGGPGGGARFDRLLDACEAFARSRAVDLETGVNMARVDAYRRVRSHGYRPTVQGVAMQRPHAAGFNRPGVYVIDDWR